MMVCLRENRRQAGHAAERRASDTEAEDAIYIYIYIYKHPVLHISSGILGGVDAVCYNMLCHIFGHTTWYVVLNNMLYTSSTLCQTPCYNITSLFTILYKMLNVDNSI